MSDRRADRDLRARDTGFRGRFLIISFALAILAGGAVGAFLLNMLDEPAKRGAEADRVKRATQGGEIGALDIAAQVQRNYLLADGSEFANVVASRNTMQDGSLGVLRVRYQVVRPYDAAEDTDQTPREIKDGIHFSICGVGENCTVPGDATPERGAFARRMALELALRMMRRDTSVDNVTVFLRVIPESGAGYVQVFHRESLRRFQPELLDQPLASLIPGAGTRLTPEKVSPAAYNKTEKYARENLYVGRYQVLGGQDALLQLQPLNG